MTSVLALDLSSEPVRALHTETFLVHCSLLLCRLKLRWGNEH